MNNSEQQYLNELDAKLWKSADKLRSNIEAANYKHVILSLIFLKYVSDAFLARQHSIQQQLTDPEHLYYLDPSFYDSEEEYQQALANELEQLDYYTEENVFWVPKTARWDVLKTKATTPVGAVLWQDEQGEDVKMRNVSWLVDLALDTIEKSNDKLKNILARISQYQVEDNRLIELISLFSDTYFANPEYQGEKLNLKSKDILGHVYEYFLGKFALAEGKNGGEYYTPKSIVNLIVEMLQPYQGRVFDPAMGSGGFFVSNDKFIETHAKEKHYASDEQRRRISIYGQESTSTTWKLAVMNMVIRGIDFNFGKKHADSFTEDQHPDLRADFVMANPPFNKDDWWHESLEHDARWQYGTPPVGNANFAWVQHMLYHLAPTGSMALLLANGSMSSNTGGEGEIRKRLIDEDVVECMVSLPDKLFTNTRIPACIWFLTKDKKNGVSFDKKKRNRSGEVLFIDARQLGYMKDRVLRDFTDADTQKIVQTFHNWQYGESYQDEAGFCYSAKLADIQKHDYILTPGRYVGAVAQEEDCEPFAEKMQKLTALLNQQMTEGERLNAEIKKNLAGLGYE
ncbi:type I restriction-modification system subunit M [Pasteurella multocida]|uniref:site-specific DNA-methyltransferase (adenine-specific) n=1 Tax=Pasteurella multocida (strain Pm70) TaxID=272843 RepID=Q9CKR9_PASMU|nr:class I SAM-dependent DNA methyltransferase [Pasteurella multocida]AAK03621.1 HsdM [Pasteurella multocida subsp. multocida str. Pm70]APW56274.1 type I restriction-modification system, M subunit [Pasteurella multocida subsp. multocida str. HN07]ARA70688.1 restriction endonuclease subunit M [Pasteurella multocida subsp. multocida]ARA89980.1 restriction endonuclease subunit M [Pasteurella multocida subsp. septica]AUL54063.1 restriction endonuclease subunit M [Pasteurella multocida]